MSGGSFNYLFSRELIDSSDINEMATAILKLANGTQTKAWKDTFSILQKVQEIRDLQVKLHDVWHAVEWYHSNDYGWDQAVETILEYEKADNNES
jgi:hypothetical protein